MDRISTTTLKSRLEQSITADAFRSYLAEFISTFIFVFAAIGSAMSANELMANATWNPSSLVAIALGNAFGLSSAVYIAANISGGHVNPAITFGLAVGGHISIPTAMFYWIAQLLGSTLACLVLRVTTAGQAVPTHAIAEQMTGFGGAIMEGVMTFALVYTAYAAGDPRRGPIGAAVGPIVVGLVVGANVLASGPFTGGSMNPACSFGSAVVNGNFKNQAVYWVGPLTGGAIAGILYENVVFPPRSSDSSRGGLSGTVV